MGRDPKAQRLTATLKWEGKTKKVGYGVPDEDDRETAESAVADEQRENTRQDECKDKVQEASEESFPASDPPAYNH